jgi:alpha-galactosidase
MRIMAITIHEDRFIIENAAIRREMVFEPGAGLRTASLLNKASGREYVCEGAGGEVIFRLDGAALFGYRKPVVHVVDGNIPQVAYNLELVGARATQPEPGVEQLHISLKPREKDIVVTCCYEVRDDFPAVAKWLEIATGETTAQLESMFFEATNTFPGEPSDCRLLTRQGLQRENPCFSISGTEDIVQIHNPILDAGLYVSNDAAGPLKRFLIYPTWIDTAVSVGYNSDTAPFTKYLDEGETFVSDRATFYLYEGAADSFAVRNGYRAYIRTALPPMPDDRFMYCSWIPFCKEIDEALITDLADRAGKMGFTSFVVDDGWFVDGEWALDTQKFPNGLEPIADHIRANGMRFGLWFNIGTDYGAAGSHPEHNTLDAEGREKTNGFAGTAPLRCQASAHRERMIEKLAQLAEQYDIGYFKLDFSSLISPYGTTRVGCHSTGHAHHRDALDSTYEGYASMYILREELKERFSDLIIDFSFETFGTARPSIAALQFSELHHVSNYNTRPGSCFTARGIRNALYAFCTVLPPERLLGSLICLQGETALEQILTSLVAAPLLSGDLRLLTDAQMAEIRTVVDAVTELTQDAPLLDFLPLRGDVEIQRNDWDGYARLTATGRGILCLFRNDSADAPHLQGEAAELLAGKVLRDALTGDEYGPIQASGTEIPWAADEGCRMLMF